LSLPNLNVINVFRKWLGQFVATPLYTNAFYLMSNYALMSLLGFFFWMIVARFYSESEVGFSAAIISAISLLATISVVGLNSSLIHFLPQVQKPSGFINSCFTLGAIVSLAVAGIFLAGLDIWSPSLSFIKEDAIFTSAFVLFTLAWTLSILMEATFIAKRQARFVLYKNTIFSLLKLPLPIVLILFFHAFGIVASWGVAIGIALAFCLFLFLPRIEESYRPVPILSVGLLVQLWRYSGGNYLANLLTQAPTWILPLMVVNLVGAKQNAYFYVAWMIASLTYAIPGGVGSSLFAESSHFRDKLRENAIKSLKFTFTLLVPAVLLLVLAGRWFLLAFGESYSANAWYLLQVLAVSALPIGVIGIYTAILRVTGRLRELIIIEGLPALVVLLASFFVIPLIGIVGIGYIWLGVQLAVALYILLARRLI